MVSYDFWQQNYAGGQSAIGSTLRLNGIVFTIVGVAPASFTGLDRFLRPSIFVPLGMAQRLDGEPDGSAGGSRTPRSGGQGAIERGRFTGIGAG